MQRMFRVLINNSLHELIMKVATEWDIWLLRRVCRELHPHSVFLGWADRLRIRSTVMKLFCTLSLRQQYPDLCVFTVHLFIVSHQDIRARRLWVHNMLSRRQKYGEHFHLAQEKENEGQSLSGKLSCNCKLRTFRLKVLGAAAQKKKRCWAVFLNHNLSMILKRLEHISLYLLKCR